MAGHITNVYFLVKVVELFNTPYFQTSAKFAISEVREMVALDLYRDSLDIT
jgi:hypothetical protein